MEKTIHTTAYKNLIAWLKECREKKGISMRDLADELGVSHSWIGKVEQMERRLDVCEYVHLCEALDVSPRTGIDKLKLELSKH
ncbi:MAG: helix-turn-helix transcriptional regulator [Pseudomonadota bacterium]